MRIIDEDADLVGLPLLPVDFSTNTFAEAIEITPTLSTSGGNAYRYGADIKRDWCIGIVPHGGYLLALLSHAVSQHLTLYHASLNQPHLANLSATFLSRAIPGPAQIILKLLKLGRQFSTVRASLLQVQSPDKPKTLCIEAQITQSNLSIHHGPSFETQSLINKASIPRREDCEPWECSPLMVRARPAAFKTTFLLPTGSDSTCSHPDRDPLVRDMWVHWPDGKPLGIEAIPFLVDAFRPHLEDSKFKEKWEGVWVPTLGLGVQVFKSGEWEWLFLRIKIGEIVNGRVSQEVVVCDQNMDVVAVASHASLVLGGERGFLKGAGMGVGAKL